MLSSVFLAYTLTSITRVFFHKLDVQFSRIQLSRRPSGQHRQFDLLAYALGEWIASDWAVCPPNEVAISLFANSGAEEAIRPPEKRKR